MEIKTVFPVSYDRHGKRFWTRFKSYHFASQTRECVVLAEEILQIAAAFPIIFRKQDEEIEPFAVLSLISTEPTPFVSDDGRWLAAYLPSALRCPPFQISFASESGAACPVLCVDEASELISDNEEGEPFFDHCGDLTAELKSVREFLSVRAERLQATKLLCQLLYSSEVLEAADQIDGVKLPEGSLIVSESRLNRLPSKLRSNLLETGAMKLLYAQLVSMSHLKWLSAAHAGLSAATACEKYTKNSDNSGFLTALAIAQSEESFQPDGKWNTYA